MRDRFTMNSINYWIYILVSIITIITAISSPDLDSKGTSLIVGFVIVGSGILYLLHAIKSISYEFYSGLILTSMMVYAFLLGIITYRVVIFIMIALVPQFCSLLFLNKKIRNIIIIEYYIALIFMCILGHILNYMQDWIEIAIFILITIILEGFLISFSNILIFQQRRNNEQELSLDDLLKVLLAKCEDARSATESKSVFLSNMSHEIRTPINAILGMDEMILRESTEDNIVEYANNINSAGRTLLGIINDVLDFSKLEAGKVMVVPATYRFRYVVKDIYNLVALRIQNKNLAFNVNVDENIPSFLLGDELRIKQIVLNILTNAIKYTEKGSITLTMSYDKLDEGNINLFISVADTGIGIKPEEMDKLFTPFERLDEKKNRSIEGTGLGMNIVMRLLNQMGSELKVDSIYGSGTTFSFTLPQKVVDWNPCGNWRQSQANNLRERKAKLFAPRANILAVDDTSLNLMVVTGLLKPTGMCVDTCESGEECLNMLTQKQYDLILLDHRMPVMDGVETLKHIRELGGRNSTIPIVALTANVTSGSKEYYLNEGFDDFLAKPVSSNTLENMILKYLPEELLKDVEDNSTSNTVNETAGLAACGSDEVYLQVVTDFVTTANAKLNELKTYLAEDDVENFTIKVHALKSTARLIGADELSKEAYYLEQCGDAVNKAEINANIDKFTEHYIKIAGELQAQYNIYTDNTKKPELNEDELSEYLMMIKEFAMAFDFEQVDNIFAKVSEYSLAEKYNSSYSSLKQAIYDVDQEKIIELVDAFFL